MFLKRKKNLEILEHFTTQLLKDFGKNFGLKKVWLKIYFFPELLVNFSTQLSKDLDKNCGRNCCQKFKKKW